jgi:acetylornithine deacetylase/succinyl-diaminopimelate desuccinylase-like protein
MPDIGENALLKMAELLARLDGRQPPFDDYPAGRAPLEALVGQVDGDLEAALERVRAVEPRLAAQLDPTLHVTLAPTMIRASAKENVIPSRCTVQVDCRVPPGLGAEHVRRRVEALIGSEHESGYKLEFSDDVVGNSSPLEGPLARALADFAERTDAGSELLPIVLPGFTDSHWFRKAFPECVAYGFFPQRAQTFFETAPLIHAPDERIAIDDLALASRFYRELALELLR